MISSEIQVAEDPFELISATRIRLRRSSPFFAALALYASIEFSKEVAIAATDGSKILFNPDTYTVYPALERDAIFLHELLHIALLHPIRRGARDPYIFNIAADIVVNGMIAAETDISLPKDATREPELEHLSVEEIYEILIKNVKYKKHQKKLFIVDILDPERDSKNTNNESKDLEDLNKRYAIEGYWKKAIGDSLVIARSSGDSNLPPVFKRHLEEICKPQVN